MPVTVSTKYLGHPEIEEKLRAGVEEFFKKYPDSWTVSILGAQTNTVWELKVTASDGRGEWVHRLHGEDGGHDIEKILTVLEQITIELPPSQSSLSGAS
jgi:hypothetical protein